MHKGKSVVMLEEGGYHTRREFDMTEARAFPNLYQDLGNRTTDDLSVSLLQGRSVGGGTTVNWCSSFRTPERILKHWAEHNGSELTLEGLTAHWEHIEKRLHVAEWPLESINRNNQILWDGLGKLGYHRGQIRRNVNNCLEPRLLRHGLPGRRQAVDAGDGDSRRGGEGPHRLRQRLGARGWSGRAAR